jgi:hypothetical protein
MHEQSWYMREKAVAAQGRRVRRANHCEQQVTEYGEKLIWVIDQGEWQARVAYKTRHAAIEAAEELALMDESGRALRAWAVRQWAEEREARGE